MYNQKSVCSGKVALIPGGSASLKIYFSYYILPSSLLVYGAFEPVIPMRAIYTVRSWILCRHFSAASIDRDKVPTGRGVKALRTICVSAS